VIKQVIVVRKDLNMRKGKMVAQGAHASLRSFWAATKMLPAETFDWYENLSTKICVGVDSEDELHKLYIEAVQAGLPAALIKDAGLTEFKEPTYTAVAIGPADAEAIDKITGGLKLL
jgi:PTH2 family peptidyl-tRNA hydrolase